MIVISESIRPVLFSQFVGIISRKVSEGEEETGKKMIPVSQEALLALADATDALRFESAAFAEWTEKINRMQEAAEAVLAYLKGDD